jgi:hypothetical protein
MLPDKQPKKPYLKPKNGLSDFSNPSGSTKRPSPEGLFLLKAYFQRFRGFLKKMPIRFNQPFSSVKATKSATILFFKSGSLEGVLKA